MWGWAAVIATVAALVGLFRRPLQEALEWVSARPNPVLQLVYLTLVYGLFFVFQMNGFPLIAWHHRLGAWAAVLGTSLSFLLLCWSDPVAVTPRNQERLGKEYVADGVLFDATRECATCKVRKIARSKHCSICGHCVHVMDHHCHWSNACIRFEALGNRVLLPNSPL